MLCDDVLQVAAGSYLAQSVPIAGPVVGVGLVVAHTFVVVTLEPEFGLTLCVRL
jgi:hypothetical protein